jgi:hypothetical protein
VSYCTEWNEDAVRTRARSSELGGGRRVTLPSSGSVASYLGLQLLWPGLFVYPLAKSQALELRRLAVPAHGVEKEHVDAASTVCLLSSRRRMASAWSVCVWVEVW